METLQKPALRFTSIVLSRPTLKLKMMSSNQIMCTPRIVDMTTKSICILKTAAMITESMCILKTAATISDSMCTVQIVAMGTR